MNCKSLNGRSAGVTATVRADQLLDVAIAGHAMTSHLFMEMSNTDQGVWVEEECHPRHLLRAEDRRSIEETMTRTTTMVRSSLIVRFIDKLAAAEPGPTDGCTWKDLGLAVRFCLATSPGTEIEIVPSNVEAAGSASSSVILETEANGMIGEVTHIISRTTMLMTIALLIAVTVPRPPYHVENWKVAYGEKPVEAIVGVTEVE